LRPLALNLLTISATLLVLAALVIPAKRVLDAPRWSRPVGAEPVAADRLFGVYVDPWHLDDWTKEVGAAPQVVAKFEAFSTGRTIDEFIDEAERRGVRRLLVSWEPWKPVPTSLGIAAQFSPQLGYRNADIASGWQDDYLERFARSLARFHGLVYLRYAHEMNGFWYPWSHDSRGYRRAWRHVVTVVRHAGARNVRMVWSVNPSLYVPERKWLKRLHSYWPGRRYVDLVGSTVINFGGRKDYGVQRFAPRLRALRRLYRKPMMITEANTEYRDRIVWLRRFRRMLRTMPWIKAVAWSQLPSRGKAHLRSVGNLAWDVQRDPTAAALLRSIIQDGLRPSATIAPPPPG
jgi:mannan endo-1,4-beta-mannosidase